jgi:hypothetical protein
MTRMMFRGLLSKLWEDTRLKEMMSLVDNRMKMESDSFWLARIQAEMCMVLYLEG